MGFTTGARIAGLTALRWIDVDFEFGRLLFLETQVDGKRYAGDKSHRRVARPLVPRIAEVLKNHRRWLISEQHPGVGTGLVFPGWKPRGKRGGHLSRSTVRKKMTQFCEDAEIPRFTPHDMKRTFVTRMSELKIERNVIKSMSAHSTDEMIFHYDDVQPERKATAVDLLLDTLEGELG